MGLRWPRTLASMVRVSCSLILTPQLACRRSSRPFSHPWTIGETALGAPTYATILTSLLISFSQLHSQLLETSIVLNMGRHLISCLRSLECCNFYMEPIRC